MNGPTKKKHQKIITEFSSSSDLCNPDNFFQTSKLSDKRSLKKKLYSKLMLLKPKQNKNIFKESYAPQKNLNKSPLRNKKDKKISTVNKQNLNWES